MSWRVRPQYSTRIVASLSLIFVLGLWVFLSPPAFAYHEGMRRSFVSLDLMTEIQERDVVERGEPLVAPKVRGDAVSSRFLLRTGLRPVHLVEIYGLVGGANLSIEEFDEFDSEMDLAYGGGFNFLFYESPSPPTLHVFLDIQYLRFVMKDQVETIVNNAPTPQDETIRWNEVISKFGVGVRHPSFRPYGGLRISFVRAKDSLSGSGKLSLREDDNMGVFGGIDIFLDPAEALAVNLEASLFDVNSFRALLRIRY